MRLFSFRIKKFKSIIDSGECKISLDDNVIILAGQNESGKSAVLESLDFFYNGPSSSFERLFRRQGEMPEVTCKFKLDDIDIENIYIETFENEQIKQYFNKNNIIELTRGMHSKNNEELLGKTYLSHSMRGDVADLISNSFEDDNVTNSDSSTEVEKSDIDNPKITFDEFENFLIEESRRFVFYEDFPNFLPGEILVSEIPENEAVKNFERVFNVSFADIVEFDSRSIHREETRLNSNASDDLNTYWSQQFEDDSKYDFIVKITQNDQDAELSKIEFFIDRGELDPLYMEQKSKGFRWFSAFNLKLRALSINETSFKNLVILIDEPGQGLHETAQKDAKAIIEELHKKGAQVIYSTHNPNLIGSEEIEFSRIRLVSNDKVNGTRVSNISQFMSRNGNLEALSPIRTAMGLTAITSLFDTENRDNVVVEGITDNYYLTAFRNIFSYDIKITFIPSCGAHNVKNIVSLLFGWGVQFGIVLDRDSHKGKKAGNELKKHFFLNDTVEYENYVYQPSFMHGIEDLFSKDDFKKLVLDSADEFDGKNSTYAKTQKKELIARRFLDRSSSLDKSSFDDETNGNIKLLFQWITDRFS